MSSEPPTPDPYEPRFVDGPFGSAEETRRLYQQACGDGPDDDLQFERLGDGADLEAHVFRKLRELQEQQLRDVERLEFARASHQGLLERAPSVLLRSALDGKDGPAYRKRLAKLLELDGAEAFARVTTLLLRVCANENPLEALELIRLLDAIQELAFRDEEEDEGE